MTNPNAELAIDDLAIVTGGKQYPLPGGTIYVEATGVKMTFGNVSIYIATNGGIVTTGTPTGTIPK